MLLNQTHVKLYGVKNTLLSDLPLLFELGVELWHVHFAMN